MLEARPVTYPTSACVMGVFSDKLPQQIAMFESNKCLSKTASKAEIRFIFTQAGLMGKPSSPGADWLGSLCRQTSIKVLTVETDQSSFLIESL